MIVTLKNQHGNLLNIKDTEGQLGLGKTTTLEILCGLNRFIDRNKTQYVISDETNCVVINFTTSMILPEIELNGELIDAREFTEPYTDAIYNKYKIDKKFYDEIHRYMKILMYMLNNC